jgi:tripartite-type tricarboxylate transporter receptor subunit TctC
MKFQRNRLLLSVGVLLSVFVVGPSYADSYPSRPIRLVVPFPPGGNGDVAGRLIAKGMSEELGQTVVVENKGGAGGGIAAGYVAKSTPDGYTVLLTTSALTISPSVYRQVPYDMRKDFVPVGLALTTSLVLVTAPNLGVKTVAELVEKAKRNPGQLTFGSAGVGSGSHMAAELFNQAAQIKAMHVPYKGSGPATIAIVSGEVDYTLTSLAAAAPLVKDGKVVALAVTGKKPSALYPSLPTVESGGYKNFEAGDWVGLTAPVGSPPAAMSTLNDALRKWLAKPDTPNTLLAAGFEIKYGSAQEFEALIQSELTKWKQTAKLAGMTQQ